ncbi:MAG: glucosaminidase domain-containing protein [Paludibacteraceae bacterium]|nr:glucosaminidase domain-containing protein [Paludibacteraceae bacterium]
MKRLTYFILLSLVPMIISAQATNELYRKYIEQYKKEAQNQQKKHGIPASITLAQGLLESAAGRSELATKANNHFGVKCTSDWKGESYRHDDETKQECFRKYKHAEESYEDHSLFLLRPRYKELFDLKITDYKGWAHGLKKCGYATDPGYAGKLIKIIEDYGLTQYDKPNTKKSDKEEQSSESAQANEPTAAVVPVVGAAAADNTTNETNKNDSKKESKKDRKKDSKNNNDKGGKNKEKSKEVTKKEEPKDNIIPPANKEEEQVAEQYQKVKMKSTDLVHEHQVYKCNGKKFIVAHAGDTFESIGLEYNIYESTLRKYNDIVNPKYQLEEGDKIYLQRKKKYAEKKYAHYRVHNDDNIWKIAQDKGMQMNSIYDLNGIPRGENVMKNQLLKLRK